MRPALLNEYPPEPEPVVNAWASLGVPVSTSVSPPRCCPVFLTSIPMMPVGWLVALSVLPA